MKSNKFIRECGPYEVHSFSQDGQGVRLEIYPAFPQYNISEKRQREKDIDPAWARDPRWAIHRLKNEGGGPSIFTTIALAEEFEQFLNQPYSETEVKSWKDTLAEAMKKIRDKIDRRFNKSMKRIEDGEELEKC
jgi:hypothetical protein